MVTQRPHTTHSLDWESDKVDGVEFSLQNLEARLVADETSPAVGSKEGGYEGGFHVFQGNIQFFLTLLQVTIERSGDDQKFTTGGSKLGISTGYQESQTEEATTRMTPVSAMSG